MQTVNANFSAASARTAQSPTYYVAIDGVAANYATHFIREPEMVVDGGFESSGIPDWNTTTTGGTVNEDTSDKYAGAQSVRLDRTAPGDLLVWQDGIDLADQSFRVGVFGDSDYIRYRCSFRCKSDTVQSVRPSVRVSTVLSATGWFLRASTQRFEDAGPHEAISSNEPDVTSSWQRYDFILDVAKKDATPFSSAPDPNDFRFDFRHSATDNSSFWYDEVSVRRADPRSPLKKIQAALPATSGVTLDILDGVRTTQSVTIELLDVVRSDAVGFAIEDITNLIATDNPTAEVSTLINRKVTIYAGFSDLEVEDYEPIFVGRIRSLSMNSDLTGYVMTLSEVSYLLDGEIYSNATVEKPSQIVGNVVNVYASLLRDVFSTSDPDFPLTSVTTDTAGDGTPNSGTSVPTGLGIPDALLNFVEMKAERDRWHLDDLVVVKLTEPVNAREHLQEEFFRAFQAWPSISGDGLMGCRFHVPALPAAAAPTIVESEIIKISAWERDFASHVNKFRVTGDYNPFEDIYVADLYSSDLAEDTTDRTDSGETIEYRLQSKWLRTSVNGVEIAEELVGRMRIRYLKTPAIVEIEVPLTKRLLEEGDVVAITHSKLPNLFTGARGVSALMMTIISRVPNFAAGTLKLILLDTGFKRYGVISPEGQADFASATDEEKETFFFISDESAQMSDGSEGYRFA